MSAAFNTPYFSPTETRLVGHSRGADVPVWQSDIGPPFIFEEPDRPDTCDLIEVHPSYFVSIPYPHPTYQEYQQSERHV